ncbi:hypothetical protein HGRIS_004705 [Hohenbuehelia grisea]|uniref:Protein-S-isoprenylcysteine O-methyltransferase n=1 Tax=Hohenbuehelia grisea TaxID=104357 RepID=A0ABR3JDH5_9AGAR
MESFVKMVALVVGAVCFKVCGTPPRPPPTAADRIYSKGMFEKIVRGYTHGAALVICVMYMVELAVVAAQQFPEVAPSWTISSFCPSTPSSPVDLLHVTPTFVLGTLLSIAATVLRLACYRRLGDMFTFEVTMKSAHTLVTSGPYAYVRHPGYTGIFVVFCGSMMVLFSSTGWITQCAVMETPFGFAFKVWLVSALWALYNFWKRCWIEDAQLKERFGRQWDMYARDVPYRMIPGVY